MAEWTTRISQTSNTTTAAAIVTEPQNDDNMCDLDLKIFCYDERARFIEKLDGSNSMSKDSSCELISDIESTETKDSYFELAKVNLSKVDPSTAAIVFYLDGGSRNFSLVNKITCTCRHTPNDRKDESTFMGSVASYQNEKLLTFDKYNTIDNEMKKYDGVALCLLYKEENEHSFNFHWTLKTLMEPILTPEPTPHPLLQLGLGPAAGKLSNDTLPTTTSNKNNNNNNNANNATTVIVPIVQKSKFDICLGLVIKHIPALEKFKPRLFSNVRDVCAALSSQALPNLKKTFQQTSKGLNISQFTRAIFNQLASTHPSVMEESEAATTVALIQEMFQQIGRW
jgi:hypothetical protein